MENGPKLTLRTAPEPGKTGKFGFKYVALMSKRLILEISTGNILRVVAKMPHRRDLVSGPESPSIEIFYGLMRSELQCNPEENSPVGKIRT